MGYSEKIEKGWICMEQKEKIVELLETRSFAELKRLLHERNTTDLAYLLEELPEEKVLPVFRLLTKEAAAEAFSEMDKDRQELLIGGFSDKELREVLAEMYVDDTVDMIEEMPANVVSRILRHSDPQTRQEINELLQYPEDSAGSIMTTEYMSLKEDMTVKEAFERIRRIGADKEDIYTCYVITETRKLIGLVTVRELLLSGGTERIGDLMETNILYVNTLDDQELVAKQFDKYNFRTFPVVDQERRLVGIITVDDAMDVLQDETTEDFEKMAAISPSEESYFKTPVWKHAKNRITWLLVLMLSSIVTGNVITRYEAAFASVPLLVAFIPMLMGTGGNCGSQTSTLVIRGLALDEIRMRDFLRVIWKESRVALSVGTILALVNAARIYVMYRDEAMALVIGITLIGTVLLSKLLGCMLPMLAKRLKLDPALMAAPLITTIVDTCSVLLYFNIALRVMKL